MVVVFQSDSSL